MGSQVARAMLPHVRSLHAPLAAHSAFVRHACTSSPAPPETVGQDATHVEWTMNAPDPHA